MFIRRPTERHLHMFRVAERSVRVPYGFAGIIVYCFYKTYIRRPTVTQIVFHCLAIVPL